MELNFNEMQAKAKELHHDAVVSLENGQWVIHVKTDIHESSELPETFRDTPAWEALATEEDNYGTDLYRWQWKNGHSDKPLIIAARFYNLKAEIAHAHISETKKRYDEETPGRNFDFFFSGENGWNNPFTEAEKEVYIRVHTEVQEELTKYETMVSNQIYFDYLQK